jgi:GTPase SAR1 family protein
MLITIKLNKIKNINFFIKMSIELRFKIIIIGDANVGKTCMLLKYVDDYFAETHIATIGAEFKTKTLIKGKYKITLNFVILICYNNSIRNQKTKELNTLSC